MLRDREHDLAVEGEALGEGRGSSGREEGGVRVQNLQAQSLLNKGNLDLIFPGQQGL